MNYMCSKVQSLGHRDFPPHAPPTTPRHPTSAYAPPPYARRGFPNSPPGFETNASELKHVCSAPGGESGLGLQSKPWMPRDSRQSGCRSLATNAVPLHFLLLASPDFMFGFVSISMRLCPFLALLSLGFTHYSADYPYAAGQDIT